MAADDGGSIGSLDEAAAVLGVEPGAGPEQVRAAYLERVRQHPPDTDPQGFERVRDAWQMLCDPQQRGRSWLDAEPAAQLTKLLEGPCFTGPQPWLEAIRQMVRP